MVLESLMGSVALFMLVAGAGLIIAEAFAPGAHFFVAGTGILAAGIVGVLLPSVIPAPIILTIMAITVLVTSVGTLYAYRELDLYGGKGKGKTSDSDSLRGKSGRVTERVTPTDGQVKLDEGGFNPYYEARSFDDNLAEGTEVIVVDPGGGNVLTVESVDNVKDEIDRELEREAEAEAEQA
ncbi:NfeD family protein [Halovenus sp. HT40]|uniref:NfeD family protein n=1 Tax=Halovenus sp. HT40 TaxID=3126691 RepID=UPI00300EDA21